MMGLGAQYDRRGLMKKARDSAAEAVALSRQASDPRGIAAALIAQAVLEVAETLPQARRQALAEEALGHARAAGDRKLVASALTALALARHAEQASPALEQAASALQDVGDARGLVELYFAAAYVALKDGRPDLARPMLDRALPLARRLGDARELMFVWGNVGLEALFSGDLDRAEAAFGEELRFCLELVDDSLAPEGLGGLAAVAARRGDIGRAARLLGAAIAIGPIADPDVLAQLERDFFEPARERYGDARWRETQAAGGLLTFEEAVDAALGRTPR
jgi:tetratricopeptide (TPR) repeat protein